MLAFYLAVVLCMAVIAYLWPGGNGPGIVALGVSLVWLVVRSRFSWTRRHGWFIFGVIVLAFVARAALAILDQISPFVPPLYTLDAQGYDEEAWDLATAWRSGDLVLSANPSVNVRTYVYYNAIVYVFVGHSLLTVRIINALLAALSIGYITLTAREIAGRRSAAFVALFVAFSPSHIFWTSHNFREAWIYYFVARGAYASVHWLKYGNVRAWLATLFFSLLAGLGRFLAGILMFGAWTLVTLFGSAHRLRRLVAAAVAGVAVALVGVAWSGGRLTFGFLDLTNLTELRQGLAVGGTAYYPELVYASWTDLLRFLPVGVLYFLFAPFPWQAESAFQLAAVVENLILYLVVALGCVRLLALRAVTRGALWLWVFLLLGIPLFAVVEGNVGTAFRHKMQFLPYLLMLLSAAWRLPKRPLILRPNVSLVQQEGGSANVGK